MKGTYLLLDMASLLLPLIFSFHKSIRFYRCWRDFLPAMAIAAIPFLVWDAYFTRLGIWGFNRRYVTGVYIGHLPVEEWLFFCCIPYACVFTVYCLRLRNFGSLSLRATTSITWGLVILLGAVSFWKLNCRYTASTFLSLAALLLMARYILRVGWLGRFYICWLILMAPLLLVDGILTGTGLSQPVVWYHPGDLLGIRIGTIPVEDVLYGMELILLNLLIMDCFERLRSAGSVRRATGVSSFGAQLPYDIHEGGAECVKADSQQGKQDAKQGCQ